MSNSPTLSYGVFSNPDNSNNMRFTSTESDSDAVFRSPNACQTSTNPMKGGYTYKRKARKGNVRSKRNYTKSQSISSVLGMDIKTRNKSGGKNNKMKRSFRQKYTSVGMTIGRKGGLTRKRRRHARKLKGGVAPFPNGYSLGGELNPDLSALANPPIYKPYNN
jgi:hypothetical protein